MKYKKIILTTLSLSMIGCASMKKEEKDLPEELPIIEVKETVSLDYQLIQKELIDAARKSSESLQILAEVENGVNSKKMTRNQVLQTEWNATYVPSGMERQVDLYWNSGPFMPVLKTISEASGYEIEIANPEMEPINQPIVTIDTDKMYQNTGKNRLIDVLRSISYQVHKLGVDIDLIENKNLLIVRYNINDDIIRVYK